MQSWPTVGCAPTLFRNATNGSAALVMRFRTYYERVTHREWVFSRLDLREALTEYIRLRHANMMQAPEGEREEWSMDLDSDGFDLEGHPLVTMTQSFRRSGDTEQALQADPVERT